MKKRIVLTLGLISVFLLTMSAVFALNCGGGWFEYGADYGTVLPYDDVRGYTDTYGYAHEGNYINYLTAYVRISVDGAGAIDRYIDGVNAASLSTGWLEFGGHDEGWVHHLAIADCNYTDTYGNVCEGYNDLNIGWYVVKP